MNSIDNFIKMVATRNIPGLIRLPYVGYYEPKFLVECNKKVVENEAISWTCAFEPSSDNPEETTDMVAACGDRAICIIDIDKFEVIKRLVDTNENEIFYTLAWTTIETHSKNKINVLAVAGESGVVKLVYPDQQELHSCTQIHEKSIKCLLFHPTQTSLLFSGSMDGSVLLSDIGIPDKDLSNSCLPLIKISPNNTVGNALCLVYNESLQLLIAGTEKGCVGWTIKNCPSGVPVRTEVIDEVHITFHHPNPRALTVDGLVTLPGDLIATKQVQSPFILIWNLRSHVERQMKKLLIQPSMKLRYPEYNVKNCIMGYNNGLLGVGDGRGNVLLYYITDLLKEHSRHIMDGIFQPSAVLSRPYGVAEIEFPKAIVVNTVAISRNHKYILGGMNKNCMCIWKKRDEDRSKRSEGRFYIFKLE